MKKWIPAVVAVVLILLIGSVAVGLGLYEKYSYSDEREDLNAYFQLSDESEVAIVLQDELIPEKAKCFDSVYYVDLDTMRKYLNDRFYVDAHEGLLLYTTPSDIISCTIGDSSYTVSGMSQDEPYVICRYEGDKLYVALDYIKKYANFSYEAFSGPNRIQLRTQWGVRRTAQAGKDTAVRYQGGVKSPILADLAQGTRVTVLEEMDSWSKVKTADAIIGYVENKCLENFREEEEVPVRDYVEPEYTSLRKEGRICLAWHQVTTQEANATLQEALADTQCVNVISPTWFALSGNEGDFVSLASPDYVEAAHARGIDVWALIDNFTYDVDLYEILSYTSKRSQLIGSLTYACEENNIDGINVDFEQVSADAGEHYVEFIRELSIACRAKGLVLSVDNYVPTEYTSHYNRKEQGRVADYVIIMGYDEHYNGGSSIGSVASIGYVQQGIADTLKDVPAEKVINGVPFYSRLWYVEDGQIQSQTMSMAAQDEFVAQYGLTPVWDEETCQNYAEVEADGRTYQMWMEDEQSLAVKLNVMRQSNLAGVACWKLTLEKPSAWNVIADYMAAE